MSQSFSAGQEDDDRVRLEAPSDKAQHLERGYVKPVCVVDDDRLCVGQRLVQRSTSSSTPATMASIVNSKPLLGMRMLSSGMRLLRMTHTPSKSIPFGRFTLSA
jgi:hypothetical protein